MPKRAYAGDDKNIKTVRWQEILHLISIEEIGTQQLLTERLVAEGYPVTQGTVSRDIRDLKLVKVAGADGKYHYQAKEDREANPLTSQFHSLYKSVVKNEVYVLNQVVIKTFGGMADGVCSAMDGLDWDGVLGTVAGDDTILVITKSELCARDLVHQLKEIRRG